MSIIKIYEDNEGLLRGHFLLSSGKHSNVYLQSEKVMMYPKVAEQAVMPLANKLNSFDFATVVSPAIGGIRFGYELARQLNKRAIFTERTDNQMTLRRGFDIAAEERVVIAEDVVTTGKSTKECIDVVKQYGGIAVAVISLIDRTGGGNVFDIPFISLTKISVDAWNPQDCPLCEKGEPVVKPGSRKNI